MSENTLTGTLSAIGAGIPLSIPNLERLTYALTAWGDDAFIGTVTLRRSGNGGFTWEPIQSWVGTTETPLTGDIASGTVRCEVAPGAWYRFDCSAFDEASDPITWLIADTVDTVRGAALEDGKIVGRDGVALLRVLDDGIRLLKLYLEGDALLPATGNVYLGDIDTEGSWRITRSDDDLVFQRREDDAWVTKSTITAVTP